VEGLVKPDSYVSRLAGGVTRIVYNPLKDRLIIDLDLLASGDENIENGFPGARLGSAIIVYSSFKETWPRLHAF
jgi:hypothetical protein